MQSTDKMGEKNRYRSALCGNAPARKETRNNRQREEIVLADAVDVRG